MYYFEFLISIVIVLLFVILLFLFMIRRTGKEIKEITQRKPCLWLDDLVLVDGRVVDLLLRHFSSLSKYIKICVDSKSSKTIHAQAREYRSVRHIKAQESLFELSSRFDFLLFDQTDIAPGLFPDVFITCSDRRADTVQGKGLHVLNVNELATLLQVKYCVGDVFEVSVVKQGEGDQGVGFTENGNLVVIEHAVTKIGKTLTVRVRDILQSKRGVVIFSEIFQRLERS